jgi:hypothetical protein
METSAHELLASWESFYVMVGGAAAVLTGLQFIVIALVADNPDLGSEDSVAAFGTPTVVHFCLCLFLAALLSAPWTSLTPVRWLLLGSAVVGLVYTLVVIRRARRQTTYRPVGEDWAWHAILPLVTYGVLIGAAVGLPRYAVTALFVVAAVALTLIFIGIHNAWDAVAYMAVQRPPKHHGEGT